ncbi:hypothetical protein [Azospirillum palustre]
MTTAKRSSAERRPNCGLASQFATNTRTSDDESTELDAEYRLSGPFHGGV